MFGEFFRIVAGHLPEDPEFVDPPLAWGDEDRVRELVEGIGLTLAFEHAIFEITHTSVEAAVACYTDNLGPVTQARELAMADGRTRYPAVATGRRLALPSSRRSPRCCSPFGR